ncbi:MAG: glucosamine-6-phosphate deaminase [Terriglobales bacterium]
MNLQIFSDVRSLAEAAAAQAASTIRKSIHDRGLARVVAATGTSQFEFLDLLIQAPEIDWKRVELFHLDEYIGLPATHPASFNKFLLDRLINRVGITRCHLLSGEMNPQRVIADVTAEIRRAPVDVAFVGVGENGHLAFNDPPADFETDEAYIVVELDEVSRRQQLSEGWFRNLDEVPRRAISMTIRQILKSEEIVCLAFGARKAEAVAKCFDGDVTPLAPASALQTHGNTFIYLDGSSAALLKSQLAEESRIR